MGAIKMRGSELPDGRLLAARMWHDGDRWMISGQFECARLRISVNDATELFTLRIEDAYSA
jgi:hypothetical protein